MKQAIILFREALLEFVQHPAQLVAAQRVASAKSKSSGYRTRGGIRARANEKARVLTVATITRRKQRNLLTSPLKTITIRLLHTDFNRDG